ncbi:MAG: endolytic transglycosylase MltG [Marinicaulis sp.]|nr:endolytic transglycosylase MltG [Marinicaulis sp.]NNL88602.1 endolytic transglycosylase MltG [Marinicaulis sp.]
MGNAGQKGGVVKSFILFLAGLLLLAGAALGVGGYLAHKEANAPGPSDAATVILLEPGSAVSTIADQLHEAGVLKYPDLFTVIVRLKGNQNEMKAGEYEIPAGASVIEIIDLLIEGKSILHTITLPEGLTTAQMLRIVNAHEILEGDLTLEPAEGELLPETYSFTRGETRDEIVREMMKAQDALIDRLWPDRAMELPISTAEEAIILASVVEKETGVPEERPLIAAVFVNRLKRGMRLQSDPTIIYGLTQGEPLGRGLRQSELRGETPYNTYVINGLPPTPIANPGAAAIAAVLNPAESDYLFFVADGTGGHAFAKTVREHEQNVANWRRIERERRQEGG